LHRRRGHGDTDHQAGGHQRRVLNELLHRFPRMF
jgi:hypothetical protein